jgi:hypothetical protein
VGQAARQAAERVAVPAAVTAVANSACQQPERWAVLAPRYRAMVVALVVLWMGANSRRLPASIAEAMTLAWMGAKEP